jgi:hypothetical protein
MPASRRSCVCTRVIDPREAEPARRSLTPA